MSSLSGVAVRRCSFKESFLKFPNIQRKAPVLEYYFNEVAGLQACNFTKKRLQHRYFPVNKTPIKNTFFTNTFGGCFCTLRYRGL